MDTVTTYRFAIGALVLAVAGLAIGLGFALADDDGMHHSGRGYMGMMGAMGDMDADSMMENMRTVMSDTDYAAMVAHMQEHRAGTAMAPGNGMDGMMHRMMDGMMAEMGYPVGSMMGGR